MSFLWPRYFSPHIPLSRRERRSIGGDAFKLWLQGPKNAAWFAGACALGLALANLAVEFLERHAAGLPRGVIAVAIIALFVAYGLGVVGILQRCGFGPYVRQALRDRGHDLCLECGYWLRGLDYQVGRCPECAKQFDL